MISVYQVEDSFLCGLRDVVQYFVSLVTIIFLLLETPLLLSISYEYSSKLLIELYAIITVTNKDNTVGIDIIPFIRRKQEFITITAKIEQ